MASLADAKIAANEAGGAGISAAMEDTLVFKALVVVVYLAANISLNILNKWTLALYGFRFPLFMTMLHSAFGCMALAPIMALPSFRPLHAASLQQQWSGLLAISGLFACSIGLNNMSLLSIPLSLNQVIRAGVPVVAAAGAIMIERVSPSARELGALGVLVSGVAVAIWEGQGQSAAPVGVLLCCLGTVSAGLMMSCVGRLLTGRLDALRLTFYTAPLTVALLLPFYAVTEHKALRDYQRSHPPSYVSVLLVGCVLATLYNIVHVFAIKLLSAVTVTVIGEMKILSILLLSSLALSESAMWTPNMVIGASTALLGFGMYSHFRLQGVSTASSEEQPPRAAAAAAETQPSGAGMQLSGADASAGDESVALLRAYGTAGVPVSGLEQGPPGKRAWAEPGGRI